MSLLKQIKTSFMLLFVFTAITGLIYPLIVLLFAQTFFSYKANGSLIVVEGKVFGSQLIGQSFTSNDYFWGRPSATVDFPYNSTFSSGSNLASTNPILIKNVTERTKHLQIANAKMVKLIPVELVTTSASGLDPDISPMAAYYQVARIAKARHLKESDLLMLIQSHLLPRTFGVFGEPRINVLQLNLALDQLTRALHHG